MEVKNDYFSNLSKLRPEEFLTGNNFALKSDLIYAEAISSKNFEKLNKSNLNYKQVDPGIFIYSIKDFEIKENDVIFCKTDYLLELFSKLDQINTLTNLKLITHQAATPWIDEKLYSLKPRCISEWYSININTQKKDLISIPLGIANNFSRPNLHAQDFLNLYKSYKSKPKKNKLYCNFRINTNPIRQSYLNIMENSSGCEVEEPNLTKKDYLDALTNYKYIFCPEGLGLDTHRFWETIYAGSIPVTKKLTIYKKYEEYFQEFLINKDINVETYKEIKFDSFLEQMLNVEYWFSIIRKNIIDSKNKEYIKEEENNYKTIEKSISKKYTRYKILKSKLNFLQKIKFMIKSVFNFDESIKNRFWY